MYLHDVDAFSVGDARAIKNKRVSMCLARIQLAQF